MCVHYHSDVYLYFGDLKKSLMYGSLFLSWNKKINVIASFNLTILTLFLTIMSLEFWLFSQFISYTFFSQLWVNISQWYIYIYNTYIIIWPNDIIITWHSWLVLSCIGSQWDLCSTFKYMTSACCSRSHCASESLHLPQLHLYRSATRWFMYALGGYFMYVMFAAAVFLTCSQQHVWMYWQ